MPFQVSFSQKATPAGIVQAISAGRDFSTLCDIDVGLTAAVLGDLQGHVLIWEQISGSPVTFTSPTNELELTYTQNNFDDKVFRFTLDKGTAFEVYDEITVFGSPLEFATIGFPAKSNVFNFGETIDAPVPKVSFLTPFPFNIHSGVAISNEYTSTALATLTWQTPESGNTLIQYIVRERDNITGVQTDIAVLPNTENYFNSIAINRTYKIVAVYKAPNSTIFEVESNSIWLSGQLSAINGRTEISAIDAIGQTLSQTSNTQLITEYDQEELSILTHAVPSSEIRYSIAVRSNQLITDYDQDILSIVGHIPPQDDVYFDISARQNTQLITEYDQELSTIGQVGGN